MVRLLMIVTAICLVISLATAFSVGEDQVGLGMLRAKRVCDGSTVGECLAEEEEFEMSSEITRRILATTKYISYGAMQRNTVPCSRRGASYYNCKPGAQANPYNRGCSSISRCRS